MYRLSMFNYRGSLADSHLQFSVIAIFRIQVLVNGPKTPLATNLKPADISPHVPAVPLGKTI